MSTQTTANQSALTADQFDNLCWRKVGYKLEDGYEPRVPRLFRDRETGIVCRIDLGALWWEGRTADWQPITLVSVSAIAIDDIHRLLHTPRQIHQLEEILD